MAVTQHANCYCKDCEESTVHEYATALKGSGVRICTECGRER